MPKKYTAAQWASMEAKSGSKKSGKVTFKQGAFLAFAGFVGVSAIGQSGKDIKADAATSGKSDATISFGPLSSKYDQLFIKEGTENGVSPILLASVAKAESEFNPNARSGAGAQGLMQFMPGTAKELGVNPNDPAQAIDGAARYLAKLKKQFGSDELAIAAYNAGPGNVQKAGNRVPKFVETQNYVAKVQANMRSAQS